MLWRNKAEIHSKRADLAKEKLLEVIRSYEQKIQASHIDIERLQEAYARTKGELTSLRNMQQQPEVIVESLKECQKHVSLYWFFFLLKSVSIISFLLLSRLFEEFKVQHSQEKASLTDEISTLKTKLTETEEFNQKYFIDITELKKCIRWAFWFKKLNEKRLCKVTYFLFVFAALTRQKTQNCDND